MNLIQYTRSFVREEDADELLHKAKAQKNHAGGRVLHLLGESEPYLVSLFFHDEDYDEMTRPLPYGSVRIFMPDCLRFIYGIS